MGRQSRRKHEQRLARARERHEGRVVVDEWSELPDPTGSGKVVRVRRMGRAFIDGINSKGGPVYTGWVPVTSSDSVSAPSDPNNPNNNFGSLYALTAAPTPSNSRTDDAARRADEASRRERERMAQEPVTIEARMPEAWEDWAWRSRVQVVGGASRPDCTKVRRDPRKASAKRKAQAQARKQARKHG